MMLQKLTTGVTRKLYCVYGNVTAISSTSYGLKGDLQLTKLWLHIQKSISTNFCIKSIYSTNKTVCSLMCGPLHFSVTNQSRLNVKTLFLCSRESNKRYSGKLKTREEHTNREKQQSKWIIVGCAMWMIMSYKALGGSGCLSFPSDETVKPKISCYSR